jgi:hypothetical protein
MEALRLNVAPNATKITVRLSYRTPKISLIKACVARQKWQRVVSALVPLSDIELAETLPELMPLLRADKAGFRNSKHYASFVIALHLLAKNIGMDLRKF